MRSSSAVVDRRHRRRARLIGHQRDLADERAWPESRHLDARRSFGLHGDLALDDHVQRVARIALVEQHLAARELDQLELGDERLERFLRQTREQRRRRERLGGGVPEHARRRQRNLLDVLELELGDVVEVGRFDLDARRRRLDDDLRHRRPNASSILHQEVFVVDRDDVDAGVVLALERARDLRLADRSHRCRSSAAA